MHVIKENLSRQRDRLTRDFGFCLFVWVLSVWLIDWMVT